MDIIKPMVAAQVRLGMEMQGFRERSSSLHLPS
jgi:hypothetical protein